MRYNYEVMYEFFDRNNELQYKKNMVKAESNFEARRKIYETAEMNGWNECKIIYCTCTDRNDNET